MLAPWKKSHDKPRQCFKKQRHHFADKGLSSQSYGFSSCHGWMWWGLNHKEGWGLKNWFLWMWGWRTLLRVPWTKRRSNQSILKEISPEYSWEGLMLNLKLQYFGHLMWRADSLEESLMLGKTEGRKRMRQQRMRLNGHEFEQTPETMKDREAWSAAVHGVSELDMTERLNNNKESVSSCFPRRNCDCWRKG